MREKVIGWSMNQNPEQKARDNIDKQLLACGWVIQNKARINLHAGSGVIVREYQTDEGPADYVLFVDQKPVGIIEAKREDAGLSLTAAEDQSLGYAKSKLKYLNNDPLPFVYESTGVLTHFTDYRDPKPRAREVYTFFRPEHLRDLLRAPQTLRSRLRNIPALPVQGLRACQIQAINNLDQSFKMDKPRALIQMATGSGKTYTAITFIYRLLKYAKAKRILFLVDTKNLGEQAEQEFMSYLPNDDNRKFTELYNVQRLKSRHIASDSQVCVHQNHIFRARVKRDKVVPKFLAYYSQSQTARDYFYKNAKQTVNLASINMTVLKKLPIPLPGISEQEQIVQEIEARLSLCDKMEQTIGESLKKAEVLRQSILKKAFEGRLVPQDPGDEPADKLLERIRLEKEAQKPDKKVVGKGRRAKA